jgi:hypothetical protein
MTPDAWFGLLLGFIMGFVAGAALITLVEVVIA